MMSTRHIKGNFERETDSISSSILEEKPSIVEVKPRVREFKEKQQKAIIEDKTEMKKKRMQEYLEQLERERKMIEKYIVDNKIVIKELPEIEPIVRKAILKWIGSANQNEHKQAITEDGKIVTLIFPKNNERCKMQCQDGIFEMPAFELEFRR